MMFPFKVTVQFNWGLRPHRHNDVCFVCPCNPQCTPLNTAYALFNSLFLLLCFNNLFASAFLLFLKFLPVNYRLGLIFSPFHSMEVVGRNYCLFKYILKYWPLHGMRFQQLLVDHRGNRVLLFLCAPPLSEKGSKGRQTERAEAKLPFPHHGFRTFQSWNMKEKLGLCFIKQFMERN